MPNNPNKMAAIKIFLELVDNIGKLGCVVIIVFGIILINNLVTVLVEDIEASKNKNHKEHNEDNDERQQSPRNIKKK